MKHKLILVSMVILFAGMVFVHSPPAFADEVDVPEVPVLTPLIAACAEITKVAISPVSHAVEQACSEYKGYPLSVPIEAANGLINAATDLYQAVAPWEWAKNEGLYAPIDASLYSGGIIPPLID